MDYNEVDEIAVDLVTYLENVEIICAMSDEAIIRVRDACRKAYEAGVTRG